MSESVDSVGRSGMVAVVGRANVGKSTLINRFLGEKISIVSPVAQTTRNLIRGVLTEPRGQMVLLDTPGMHKAGSDLGLVMNRSARKSIEGVDAVLLLLDGASRPREEDEGWMRRLGKEDVPVFLALNKVDVSPRFDNQYRDMWARTGGETVPWFCISASTGAQCDELLAALFACLPVGPALFPEDTLTDFPRKLHISDVIREKLFGVLHDELPHAVAVSVGEIAETEDTWHVDATVYVDRSSQKAIVIGEKARNLRKVRRQAERELGEVYERKVRLHLWVKVEKHWARNHWILKQLGYV